MHLPKVGIIALVTFLIVILNAHWGLTISSSNLSWKTAEVQLVPNYQVLTQNLDNRKTRADGLLRQATKQIQTEQLQAAIQSAEQALTIYKEISDTEGESKALKSLADIYFALGDYTKALEYQQQSWAIEQSLFEQQLDELKLSLEQLRESTLQREELPSINTTLTPPLNHPRQTEAEQLLQQAKEESQQYQLEAAIQSAEQALAIYRAISDREGERKALDRLGKVYSLMGNYSKALEYYDQSLAILQESNELMAQELDDTQPERIAQESLPPTFFSMMNQGRTYRTQNDYAKAVEYFEQALTFAQESNNLDQESHALSELGSAYLSLGNYAKALAYTQEYLVIARKLGNLQQEYLALSSLGSNYGILGDNSKAIEFYEQALTLAQEIGNPEQEASALNTLGSMYFSISPQEYQAQVINYHHQALTIARAIGDLWEEYRSLNGLSGIYSFLEDYDTAIEYSQQTLAIAPQLGKTMEGNALAGLGNVYLSQGDYAQAIDYYQQGLAIARSFGKLWEETLYLENIASAYSQLQEYDKVIEYEQKVLAIARELGEPVWEGYSLGSLGHALFKAGKLAEAEKMLFAALEIQESQRQGLDDSNKISFLDTGSQIYNYRTLQQVLIAQNKTNAALEIAERARARAFVELLATRLASNSIEVPTINPPNIQQIQQIAQAQNATLVEYSIIGESFQVKQQPTFDSQLYIWVIQPTGKITFRQVELTSLTKPNNSLASLVVNTRKSLGVRGRAIITVDSSQESQAKATERLQQLHQILIQPIADLLTADPTQKVIFMPQGYLFLVPFPALQDKLGKHLIEKHTILTAPSIQVLHLTRQQRDRIAGEHRSRGVGKVALVVGNPTMPSLSLSPGEKPQQLSSLPGAERETNAIAPLLNTLPLIGNQATETAIKQQLGKARIIHLATHGLLDEERGLGSAIALTPSSKDDGLLTAEEILNFKLNAELVVLSACDTGRGRITGDGVVGLSRSFISAGVPSIIVSLWQVPDTPTASLMTQFYQSLSSNPNKAQALRSAMLATMKQHPNPKNWAAFTLIGEAN